MKRLALTLVASLVATSAFAQDWTKSPYGPEDEIGALNKITPESVLAASKLVKTGKTYALGIVVDSSTPAFAPRTLSVTVLQPNQISGSGLGPTKTTYNDDIFMGWLGIGSQIDGLGHLGEAGMYYNCNDNTEISQITGLAKLGVHDVPPLVSRGIVLDMTGDKDMLAAGEHFGEAEIKAAAAAAGVTIGKGDIVLFHTGWTENMLDSDPKVWVSGEPGINVEGSRYLASLNVMAVGADTWGIEPVPPAEGDGAFYGHVVLLQEHGIYILETMNTGPLVRDGVSEFMFVLGQARIRGTVQMIINPVALY